MSEDDNWRTCAKCGEITGYLYWSRYCNTCRPKEEA